MSIEYLHTMVRVADVDASLKFYCEGLGLEQVRRVDNEKGRFTLVFLASPADVERLGGARRPYGFCPVSGRHFGRAATEGRAQGPQGTMGQRREYRRLVENPCRLAELR